MTRHAGPPGTNRTSSADYADVAEGQLSIGARTSVGTNAKDEAGPTLRLRKVFILKLITYRLNINME